MCVCVGVCGGTWGYCIFSWKRQLMIIMTDLICGWILVNFTYGLGGHPV